MKITNMLKKNIDSDAIPAMFCGLSPVIVHGPDGIIGLESNTDSQVFSIDDELRRTLTACADGELH